MKTETQPFIHRFEPAEVGVTEAPTLLLLHGTGGDENDLISLGQTLYPSAALLSLRGKVLEHGMPRFFRRFAEGVFDLEDLRLRTHELADYVAEAAQTYGFDPKKVIAVGFSNGANIAASTLLLRPETLSGAILLRAMVPFLPETRPDLKGVPVLLEAGRLDPIASPDEAERLAALFRSTGAEVTLEWHDTGHNLTNRDVQVAKQWLQTQTR